jgi:hypothetical protein
LSRIPLGRTGEAEDPIGRAIYLLSPASDFAPGQVMYVDGAFTAGSWASVRSLPRKRNSGRNPDERSDIRGLQAAKVFRIKLRSSGAQGQSPRHRDLC